MRLIVSSRKAETLASHPKFDSIRLRRLARSKKRRGDVVVSEPYSSSDPAAKKKAIPRRAAGQSWEDPTLTDWPDNDYRLFCGDLGNEVNDDVLSKAFSRFPSFNMARVVRDKRTGKTKGYGFVSFSNPTDLAGAIKEMNGKYVGNRPIKLRKSNWKERTDVDALERQKNHIQKKPKMPKKSILHKKFVQAEASFADVY
uniref:RRM domain-containing protein n=1 Tax=Oryza meridionalis TaxID=40149 RepID=A0A0E0EP88_9ORYZ